MISFKEKMVAVLGAGLEGVSSANFLKQQGALISVLDQKEEKDLDSNLISKIKSLGVKTIFGEKSLEEVEKNEVLVRTPGIRPDIPELSRALSKGALLTSNTKMFFELCPAQIIGVTGTKGKGTAATLIYKILQDAGKNAYLGGNIGTPALDLLPNLKPEDWVVLELSSFQLFDLDRSPAIAVVLMVTSEHLDWHKDHDEYKMAKFNLVRYQNANSWLVINIDYPVSREFLLQTQAKKIEVSTKTGVNQGVFVNNGAIYRKVGSAVERVIDANKVGLIGPHNLENVAAAIGAATAVGVSTQPMSTAIQNFHGLEHRLEFVREVGGVGYYNDSFSTTPETAIAALKSFQQPEILILGGSDKGSDYTELGKTIINSPNIKAVILIGQMSGNIKQAIMSAGTFKGQLLENATNMVEIINQARSIAVSGYVVVLSPACASFGMFKNYKDRGMQFKETVNKL